MVSVQQHKARQAPQGTDNSSCAPCIPHPGQKWARLTGKTTHSAPTRRDKWVCCSYIHRAMTEKLQQPNPGFLKNGWVFFLVSQRKDCYGRSSSKKEQASIKYGSLHFVYYMNIKPSPPHSRFSHSGSLLFLGYTVNSSPSMHWYLPFPDQDSNSFLQPQHSL